MDWMDRKPIDRLSLLPWLPGEDQVAHLGSEIEREIWAEAIRLSGWRRWNQAVPLRKPFSSLVPPAVEGDINIVSPPIPHLHEAGAGAKRDTHEITEHVATWKREVEEQLRIGLPDSPNRAYCLLHGLAQAYLSELSVEESRPDIGLLDQRQWVSALAGCLWHWRHHRSAAELSSARLGLLCLDLSGIQSYLFGSARLSVGGGVARTLRARSFFLAQATSLLAWRLLDTLDLRPGNLVWDAGGKTFLLYASTPDADAAIETMRHEADMWSLSELGAEIAIELAQTTFTLEELCTGNFGRVWLELSGRTEKEKAHRLRTVLQDDKCWREEVFLMAPRFSASPCASCGRYDREEGDVKCKRCQADESLGRGLLKADWLAYSRRTARPGENVVEAFGWQVVTGAGAIPDDAEWIAYLRQPDKPDSYWHVKQIARHVPTTGRELLTFEEIAERSKGRKYLGYLKADVDRLSERIAFGLPVRRGSVDGLLLFTHLSRSLSNFFAGNLDTLIRERFPLCYIIYSGGDDLTIVGPHDEILSFVAGLAQSFREHLGYASAAPSLQDVLTLSAGMAIVPSHLPVPLAVGLADDALNSAKEDELRESENLTQRCAVNLLGQTYSW